jgi:hypothetical protein
MTGLGMLVVVLLAQGQPIDFPHNTHVSKVAMECIDCHSRVDTRAEAGLPSVRKCMLCHQKIAVDKPGVKALHGFAEKKHEVPWVRVFGFEREAQVKFMHAPHVRAKIACTRCHGAVEKMTVAEPAVKHTMGTCVSCHREHKASTECIACHF